VVGLVAGERVREDARAAVDERVVGHDRFRRVAAELCEPVDRSLERCGGGLRRVGAVAFRVGQAAVVVDDAVDVDVSGAARADPL
jgi:hypothetical protein